MITFILFECHISIDKSTDFHFFSVIVKEFIVTKSSAIEIQNLAANLKLEPVKSNSKQYKFLFKYVFSKNQ